MTGLLEYYNTIVIFKQAINKDLFSNLHNILSSLGVPYGPA